MNTNLKENQMNDTLKVFHLLEEFKKTKSLFLEKLSILVNEIGHCKDTTASDEYYVFSQGFRIECNSVFYDIKRDINFLTYKIEKEKSDGTK